MSTLPQLDIGERRAARAAGRPLRSVMVAVASFYVFATLFNGTYLYESAKQREFGKVRSVWVAATKPLAEVSEFLRLHFLRDQVEKIRKE